MVRYHGRCLCFSNSIYSLFTIYSKSMAYVQLYMYIQVAIYATNICLQIRKTWIYLWYKLTYVVQVISTGRVYDMHSRTSPSWYPEHTFTSLSSFTQNLFTSHPYTRTRLCTMKQAARSLTTNEYLRASCSPSVSRERLVLRIDTTRIGTEADSNKS